VPSFDVKSSFHGFCGARAKSTRGDWIIEPSSVDKAFIQVAGIDSPGLAGSPAIALEVVELLVKAGLSVGKNANFNPNRAPIIIPKNGLALHDGTKMRYTKEPGEKMDPRQNIVCKCEKVTEQEIVTALHRSLPIDSTQAIRKRTRAGTTHSFTHSLTH
jgi:glycerol-3-phosphate dehydrogenase